MQEAPLCGQIGYVGGVARRDFAGRGSGAAAGELVAETTARCVVQFPARRRSDRPVLFRLLFVTDAFIGQSSNERVQDS